jgi:hypothetical protein
MTIVLGEIETLKRLKSELKENGITRFNSVGLINGFLKTYQSERDELILQAQIQLEADINDLLYKTDQLQVELAQSTQQETERIAEKIKSFEEKVVELNSAIATKGFFIQLSSLLHLWIVQLQLPFLRLASKKLVKRKTKATRLELEKTIKVREGYLQNKEEEIRKRSLPQLNELDHTKEVVDGLSNVIAGAIGESKVVNALKKLPNENTLINDYSLTFDPPIFRKTESDRIFSIQIDHLLLTRAGIFIIETKNWSKESVESIDLRSPVEQIRRSSYALFTVMSSTSGKNYFRLKRHPWGDKKVPIRSIIAMAGHKPKEQFKYVQIKEVNELNSYISYFEPIFDEKETNEISQHLERMNFDGRP